MFRIAIVVLFCLTVSCKQRIQVDYEGEKTWNVFVSQFTSTEYADNPDRFNRHSQFGHYDISNFSIDYNYDDPAARWGFTIGNDVKISMDSIRLFHWIPSIPRWIEDDETLIDISLQNQEFNRQQVIFREGAFNVEGAAGPRITRVDVARNCLQAYLWEVIIFADEDGADKIIFHGWFEFPKLLYREMFEQRNQVAFSDYAHLLEEWSDLKDKSVSLDKMRSVVSGSSLPFTNQNDQMYSFAGERFTKAPNILYPSSPSSISSFLSDSTRFATFTAPGVYKKTMPRETQLSLLAEPVAISRRSVLVAGEESYEFEIEFASDIRLIFGGLSLASVPSLDPSLAHKGLQMPMGIGNHTFYENYQDAIQNSARHNTYYGLLLDGSDIFVDSHAVGIDGPLLHFDADDPSLLHIWILSFERHSFVGHYTVKL